MLAQARLHRLIPGGAHTYARGSDQFPENMTPVLVRGRGARVEDLDGNWLIEYGMGLRSVTLGHGYEPVVDAVCRAAADGVNFSRPSVWELRAAEEFLRAGSGRGYGEVRQEWFGRHHRGDQAGAGGDRS